jgi:hypothetical protein
LVTTSTKPIDTANFAEPVINQDMIMVSIVPVTRHEMALAKLLLWVSIIKNSIQKVKQSSSRKPLSHFNQRIFSSSKSHLVCNARDIQPSTSVKFKAQLITTQPKPDRPVGKLSAQISRYLDFHS